MIEPKYKDLLSINIPSRTENGVHVKIVTGECMGFSVPSYTYTPIYYLDFRLESNASFTQKIPEDWNAFILILDGIATIGTNKLMEVDSQNVVILTKEGDSITFKNEKPHLLRLVLVAGMPLNEPVVQNGPFVMSTEAEIEQAYKDLKMFKNGFENAREWLSNAVKEKKF
jgi:redox-sensitive bicupin YhaK (pirin superfamily)